MTTSAHRVDTIIGWITPRFEAIGLALNLNKRIALTHPECPIRFSTIQQSVVGTEILVLSIGTHDNTQQHLYSKYTDHTQLLSIFSSMDAQSVDHLLQACVNTQPMYLLRILPPSQLNGFTLDFDYVMNRTIASIADSPTTQLEVHSHMLRAIQTALDELGIPANTCHKKGCYLASTLYANTFETGIWHPDELVELYNRLIPNSKDQ